MFLINEENCTLKTKGLLEVTGFEIKLRFLSPELVDEAKEMLNHIADGLTEGSISIDRPRSDYGYWPVVFARNEDLVEINEHSDDFKQINDGVKHTLSIFKAQRDICLSSNSEFDPPKVDQIVILSPDVLNGGIREGRRYNSLTDKSGWLILGDEHNEDKRSLIKIECGELSLIRPDLTKYLALEEGFYFFSVDGRVERV